MPDLNFIESLSLQPRETSRIWVVSDIQSDPAQARNLLTAAIDDLLDLKLDLDAVWCPGDALRGPDEEALGEVADIFIEQMGRLNLPVCYLMGNHDMDFRRAHGINRYPLFERARRETHWHTMDHLDDFFFARRMGNCLIVFMGDHADPNGSWFTSHGGVSGDCPESYPHTGASYARLSQAMENFGGPVIIVSHYALPGGQKPSPLMARLFPLPDNVSLFLHGHAHIGDLVWNKENPWQRDNPIAGHRLRQFNVSALESTRSPGSHSAILELGEQGPVSLRIRCHQERKWTENLAIPAL